MKNEFLKTLWMLRFEKVKQNEDTAAWTYQEILDECLMAFGEEDQAIPSLRRLVRDERMHAKLAEELIRICRMNHPEYGTAQ